MPLFYRIPSHLLARTTRRSGRNHQGGITIWGRCAVSGFRPWKVDRFMVGTYRVWAVWTTRTTTTLLGLLVGRGGLCFVSGVPAQVVSGSYLTTSFLPVAPTPGLSTLLRWVPVGALVSSLSFFGRAPGTYLKVLRHRHGKTECRLPSRKTAWLNAGLLCVVGANGNNRVNSAVVPNAGASWLAGWRPRVRGVAMNPIDHPHGGGQGKTAGGRPAVTPWGRLTKGQKTR